MSVGTRFLLYYNSVNVRHREFQIGVMHEDNVPKTDRDRVDQVAKIDDPTRSDTASHLDSTIPLWGVAEIAPRHPEPIFGRDGEIGELREVFQLALEGCGGLALVSGEAGIGKTTLVERLADEVGNDRATILSGHCYDLEATPPYGPWIDLFRGQIEEEHPLPLVATASRLDEEPQLAREELISQVWDYLTHLAAKRPLVLILEDLHWADQASLELLQVLIHQLRSHPILLIATYRDAELVQDQPLYQRLPGIVREGLALRLSLRRLEPRAISALLDARYPTLDQQDVTRLTAHLDRYSQGNPLFIEEILFTLEVEHMLHLDQETWKLSSLEMPSVPPLVQQMMEGRMQLLDERSRELLQVAAVLGTEIQIELWQEVAGAAVEELAIAVEHGLSSRILEEVRAPAAIRFRHAMLREVLYRDIAVTTRQRWHRKTGEVLATKGESDPMSVAHHFLRGDDDRAIDWLILAGQFADYTSAFSASIESYERALALLERDPERQQERGWLLCSVAEALRHSDPRQALARVEEAQAIAIHINDQALQAITMRSRSHIRGYLGFDGLEELETSIAAYDALSEIDKERIADSPLRYTVSLGTYAQRLAYYGRFEKARRHALEYLDEIEERPGLASEKLTGIVYFGLAWAQAALGFSADAQQTFERSRTYNRTLNNHYLVVHAYRYEYLSVLHVYFPDLVQERRQMIGRIDEHFEILEASHFSDAGQVLRLSSALILDGRWQEAYADANSQMHLESLEIDCATVLAQLDWLQGRAYRAWIHIRNVLPEGPDAEPSTPYFLETLILQRVAAELALDAHNLNLARRWIEALERWLDWSDIVAGRAAPHLLRARLAEQEGRLDAAIDAADSALAIASNPRQPLDILAAHRRLARIHLTAGNLSRATEHSARALEIGQMCAAPFEVAATQAIQAEIALASQDIDAARALIAMARQTAERLEALRLWAQIEDLEERLTASQETPELPVDLTRREIQVLRLVAQGLTDAEIGEELHISPRTASGHLQSIYNKLDVNSRTAATAFAFAHKLV